MKSERSLVLLFGALLAGMAVAALTVFVPDAWHHSVDSAIYILTSRSLAAGEGLTYLGRPFFVRPPGLPFLLQPFAAEPVDFHALALLVQGFAVLSFATVALAMRRVHRPALALLVAFLYAANTLTVEAFGEVLAEFPFTALFFLGLWLASPCRDGRQPRLPRALLGALFLAASCYFRTVGVIVIPGLVLVDLFRRDGRRWQGLLLAGVVALAVAPWIVHGQRASAESERPSTQLLMYSYSTAMFHTDPRDPDSPVVDLDGWIKRLQDNAMTVGDALSHAFFATPSGRDKVIEPTLSGYTALALTALCALYALVTRRSLLDWYLAAYGVIVLTYFTFVDRLLVPAMPLVLSAIVYTVTRLARLGAKGAEAALHREAQAATLLCGLLMVVGAFGIEGFLRPPDRHDEINFEADRAISDWVRQNTRPGETIMHEKGAIIGLLSGRTTYTWRNLPRPWPEGAPDVDWILIGPREADLELAVSHAAVETLHVPVPWFRDRDAPVRFYHMKKRK
ncbi:MAG: hypothetical protein H6825_15510 [Planctomycetes bacterium]|nr:hypothetical protein [Planctomycetota bacterium]